MNTSCFADGSGMWIMRGNLHQDSERICTGSNGARGIEQALEECVGQNGISGGQMGNVAGG